MGLRTWTGAAACVTTVVALGVAPAQAATPSPANGGPVIVVGGSSPAHGRVGVGTGRVGTMFTLTPVRGGCPHRTDVPLVRWKAPYHAVAVDSMNGNSTGAMPTGAPAPGQAAANPGTYSASLECWSLSADGKHLTADKVFAPASITLTGRQLLPALSRTSVRPGGTVRIGLPGGLCKHAGTPALPSFVDLLTAAGKPVALLKSGVATIPTTVAPGRYFVTGSCSSATAAPGAPFPGYAYGFAALTVAR